MLDQGLDLPRKGERTGPICVLAVDDDPIARFAIEGHVLNLGYECLLAESGREALSVLTTRPAVDLVLLDQAMPGMNGLEVFREMRSRAALKDIPVVMVTGTDDPADVRRGIEAGIFYHLPKPADADVLAGVMSAAIRRCRELAALRTGGNETRGFALATTARYEVRTLDEAESLAGFIANYFHAPERVLPGIGALLVNAVEHGLCGIGYDTKGELLRNGVWREEVEKRSTALPAESCVQVVFVRRKEGDILSITDPGPGFAWRDFLDVDTSRPRGSHGRGLLQARSLSFDRLQFNQHGNQVVGLVTQRSDLEW